MARHRMCSIYSCSYFSTKACAVGIQKNALTVNPGRDPYKPLWKFLPNLLIVFQYSFQIQWWIWKLTLNLWKNFRADFIYLHFNLHQWLVYKTSVISPSHVTIQGTCWKWKYLSRFYCEEIMYIDFDEDKRKLPTKSFLKYSGSYQPTPSLTKLHCHINTFW